MESLSLLKIIVEQAPYIGALVTSLLVLVWWFLKFLTVKDQQLIGVLEKKDLQFIEFLKQVEERIQLFHWELSNKTNNVILKNNEALDRNTETLGHTTSVLIKFNGKDS